MRDMLRRFVLVSASWIFFTLALRETVPAVRVVRFQVDYFNASLNSIANHPNWPTILRISVLASLRFINKHWLVCGGSDFEKRANDCGKLHVTGEMLHANAYRINATFIAERDPIQNARVDSTSTVIAVMQIGLRGGIFQYTNALKILGKPQRELNVEEAFFCYRGSTLVDQDKCMLCERGKYHDISSNKCERCPRGFFQPKSGTTNCMACNDGFTTISTGSAHKSSCIIECSHGHYLDIVLLRCAQCGYFAYQPTKGSTSCILCPPGAVTYITTASSLEQCLENCPAGYEYTVSRTCTPCRLGYYKPPTGLICKQCEPEKTTETTGSTSESSCTLKSCPLGYYLNKEFAMCLRCDRGYYQDEIGTQFCKKCPLGTTTRTFGSSSIKDCLSTNQCITGEHKCHWLAACFDLPDINNRPSYSCKCQSGFIGSGFDCTDSCWNFCLNGAKCKKNTRGEPKCICPSEYVGMRCDYRRRSL